MPCACFFQLLRPLQKAGHPIKSSLSLHRALRAFAAVTSSSWVCLAPVLCAHGPKAAEVAALCSLAKAGSPGLCAAPTVLMGMSFSHRRGWDELWEALVPGACMEDMGFELAENWLGLRGSRPKGGLYLSPMRPWTGTLTPKGSQAFFPTACPKQLSPRSPMSNPAVSS